jgi:peroxiredoxin
MTNTPQSNYLDLPDNLPIPQDDGAADHLDGIKLNPVFLTATNGELIDLSTLKGTTVVFIYPMLKAHLDNLFGLSVQSSAYQKELKDRVDLPYEILSDEKFEFADSLKLPTFEANFLKLLKRLTLIIKDGVITKHHYPVFPSNKDVDWVLAQLP